MNWVRQFAFRKLAAFAVLIAVWECTSKLVPSWPSAFQVAVQIGLNFQQPAFLQGLVGSLQRMAIGYVLVTVVGISFGIVIGRFKILDELLGTFAVAVHAIPGAAW